MNPIASKIAPGLSSWKKIANVMKIKNGKIMIPRIIVGEHDDAVLICTGLHLEETSGPLIFLDHKNLDELLKIAKKRKLTLIIYPLINNFGLDYAPDYEEKFLRRNEAGINYNDGWGMKKKAIEVSLAEQDMDMVLKKYNVKLTMSLHEDSVCVKKGYLWINGLPSKSTREKIYKEVKKNIKPEYLLKMENEKDIVGGFVENEISVVDSKDEGAFEEWIADKKIPVVLSEAPFAESLEVRKNFHLEVIKASIKAICD